MKHPERHYKRWTVLERTDLIRNIKNGLSFDFCANFLRRSLNSVQSKFKSIVINELRPLPSKEQIKRHYGIMHSQDKQFIDVAFGTSNSRFSLPYLFDKQIQICDILKQCLQIAKTL